MCTYCMIGDWTFRHNPPWQPSPPMVPQPLVPPMQQTPPWPLEKLVEFNDLLKRVKALEDALGCPCEPNKADYIGLIEERIKNLEQMQEAAKREGA